METKNVKEKSITVNLVVNGIKTLMSVLFPLITFPYASRVLGASGIGKVNYAQSVISYFALVAALGISIYAVREGARIREDKEKFNQFAKEMLGINLCTTVLAYLALVVFLKLPLMNGYKQLLMISSAGMLFTTVAMEWLFVIKEDYMYITKRAIAFQFLSLVLLFLLVRSKEDYPWYAALTVISSGGSAILNIRHSRKYVDWGKHYQCEYFKHLKPIFLIFGTSVASSIYTSMDTTMLGAMQGDAATGIYTAAVKINLVISTLIGTISLTILPRVSYYIGNGLKKQYQDLMKTSVNILFMIAVPAAIGMMCTSDILILLFSGEEFISGSFASKILSAKVVVGAINRVLAYQVCTPHKMDKEVLISTVSGAVFNLIANATLIPMFGPTGAAWATLCSEVVVFVVLTKYSRKVLEMKRLYNRLPVYLGASIWFFLCRWIVEQMMTGMVLQLLLTVGICMFGYVVLLLIGKDQYLREFFQEMLGKIWKRNR